MRLLYVAAPGELADPDELELRREPAWPREEEAMKACCVCGYSGPDLEPAGEQRGEGGRGWVQTYGCTNVNACLKRLELRDTATPRTATSPNSTVQGV